MRGGFRPGSGRKPGSKTRKRAEEAVKSAEKGITPLQYMLNVLRDPTSSEDRKQWAAEKSAPFIHPRLNATTIIGDLDHHHYVIDTKPITENEWSESYEDRVEATGRTPESLN